MKPTIDARTTLAFGITVAAIGGITLLSWIVIATIDAGVIDRAQNVFNAVLPLFGTWIGTVLAYYFSRENFETASNKAQELVSARDELLRSTRVSDVMIKTIYSISDLSTKAEEVLEELADKKYKRFLILQPSGALQALLYLEDILSYLYEFPKTERSKKTLDDLLREKQDLKKVPAYVSERATLAEAKSAMEKIENCKVILVTGSGNANERVLGLLTNTDIVKYSRA